MATKIVFQVTMNNENAQYQGIIRLTNFPLHLKTPLTQWAIFAINILKDSRPNKHWTVVDTEGAVESGVSKTLQERVSVNGIDCEIEVKLRAILPRQLSYLEGRCKDQLSHLRSCAQSELAQISSAKSDQ